MIKIPQEVVVRLAEAGSKRAVWRLRRNGFVEWRVNGAAVPVAPVEIRYMAALDRPHTEEANR